MNTRKLIEYINSGGLDSVFSGLYGKSAVMSQRERYSGAVKEYERLYEEADVTLFSVPGRSEISGNHTDHNGGKVIAASINLDIIAVASPTDDGVVKLKSRGFDEDTVVLSERMAAKEIKYSAASLIAGVCDGFIKRGLRASGFRAYTTSNVFKGSGLSSSAAFEVMIGNILRTLYKNDVSDIEIAKIAQYAENEFFGKPCGLMDQTACAVGGLITIDFRNSEDPEVSKLDFDLSAHGCSLCIVDTGGNHADLNEDYASVPEEMRRVASLLGVGKLRMTDKKTALENAVKIRSEAGDRALLRALHFFDENERVTRQVEALKKDDLDTFFELVTQSGNSSFRFLQNVYTTKNVFEQGLSLALWLAEDFIKENNIKGACRVHGGGFAGTIQVFVPEECASALKERMETVFGPGSCHILSVRMQGAVALI